MPTERRFGKSRVRFREIFRSPLLNRRSLLHRALLPRRISLLHKCLGHRPPDLCMQIASAAGLDLSSRQCGLTQ